MEKNEKRVRIGDNYEYSPDGTLYYIEGKEDKNLYSLPCVIFAKGRTPLFP